MGRYTEHWDRYRKTSNRSTLRLLGVVLCLPVIAAAGYGLSQVSDLALPILGALLVAWLVTITVLALRASRVPCPRCMTVYSRGKGLIDCPRCGLRMLDEDPS